MTFDRLGLGAALVSNCARAGYGTPSPIQAQAIPIVLEGGDLLAAAQTGTGKTAAFLLPLLHAIGCAKPPNDGKQSLIQRRTPRVLVLAPTRELAAQIGESARVYGAGLNVRSQVVYGGVSQRPQAQALSRGIDLLIATPGRLLDLHQQRLVDLSQVEHVVLDEADRMLDMGFIRDLKRILALLPKSRQTLLFSATFSPEIRDLSAQFLSKPQRVEIAPQIRTAERVEHHLVRAPKAHKRALLSWLIGHHRWEQVLVFARTKHGADRLARHLSQDGLSAVALHGGKTQGARGRALDGFKKGQHRVLVATDIAARGLDIAQLPCVVNYELPNVPEDYVHRIGRTGRAGASGLAVSLVDREEDKLLRDIERVLRTSIPAMPVEGFVPPTRDQIQAGSRADAQADRSARADQPRGAKPRRPAPGAAKTKRPPRARPSGNASPAAPDSGKAAKPHGSRKHRNRPGGGSHAGQRRASGGQRG